MGEVVRISTGAAVPASADIVIPVENTYVNVSSNGEEKYIEISHMDKGRNIRYYFCIIFYRTFLFKCWGIKTFHKLK